eukprot:Platyproteum_vivax@DN10796_c0_g1_i1.p3
MFHPSSIVIFFRLIGKATEDLAEHTGQLLGGLINATFGNIVEMLLCVAGLREYQISLVQCTLMGSIISNLLLVLGCAFIVGGLFFKVRNWLSTYGHIDSNI